MRIIIFSDSLGRPRPDLKNSSTSYEDIYGYKIKKTLGNQHEVEILYIESLDSHDAIHWSQRMVAFRNPDIVIFHFGVNDCAPRIFKKGSRSVLFNKTFKKITFNIFMRIISKYRYFITKTIKRTYTSKVEFKENILKMICEIKKYNNNASIFAISIAYPSIELNKRSYNYESNVKDYNNILKGIFKDSYIEVNDLIDRNELLIEDGIHLTKRAHQLLSKKILNKLSILLCVE